MSTEHEANLDLANSIDQLGSLYRAELAAVQTYVAALCHASLGRYGDVLRRQKRVHEERGKCLSEGALSSCAPKKHSMQKVL